MSNIEMFGVGLILGALLIASPALGHDTWISRNDLKDPQSGHPCCDHRDCAEVRPGGVKHVAGGYLIADTEEIWPTSRVVWGSQDGKWWRCAYSSGTPLGNLPGRRTSTRCLIGPPQIN